MSESDIFEQLYKYLENNFKLDLGKSSLLWEEIYRYINKAYNIFDDYIIKYTKTDEYNKYISKLNNNIEEVIEHCINHFSRSCLDDAKRLNDVITEVSVEVLCKYLNNNLTNTPLDGIDCNGIKELEKIAPQINEIDRIKELYIKLSEVDKNLIKGLITDVRNRGGKVYYSISDIKYIKDIINEYVNIFVGDPYSGTELSDISVKQGVINLLSEISDFSILKEILSRLSFIYKIKEMTDKLTHLYLKDRNKLETFMKDLTDRLKMHMRVSDVKQLNNVLDNIIKNLGTVSENLDKFVNIKEHCDKLINLKNNRELLQPIKINTSVIESEYNDLVNNVKHEIDMCSEILHLVNYKIPEFINMLLKDRSQVYGNILSQANKSENMINELFRSLKMIRDDLEVFENCKDKVKSRITNFPQDIEKKLSILKTEIQEIDKSLNICISEFRGKEFPVNEIDETKIKSIIDLCKKSGFKVKIRVE